MGPISGRIDNIVGVMARGKNIVRRRPKKSTKPTTIAVITQRNKLAFTSNFLKPLRRVISLGYKTGKAGLSPYEAAIRNIMLHNISGHMPEYTIELPKLKLSNGSHYAADTLDLSISGTGGLINISWDVTELNESEQVAFSYDQLTIVFYNEQSQKFQTYPQCAYRISGAATISIPPDQLKAPLHVWFFFTTENGKTSSPTKYLEQVVPPEF